MNAKPALTVCAVTMDRERVLKFLQYHLPAATDPAVEWLIFCEEEMVAQLEAEWPEKYSALSFVAHRPTVAINEKRNLLLQRARGECIIFLDDDAFIEEPATGVHRIIAACTNHPWTLFTTCYRSAGEGRIIPPDPFATAHPGSCIEWNQAFQVEALRKAGGWNPLFGPGGKWPSGEAFTLMFTLQKLGFKQQPAPEITISHPEQAVASDLSDLAKFRRYRRALGSVLLYLRPHMTGFEFAAWFLRLTIVPMLGVVVALLWADIPLAVLRFLCPYDVLHGMRTFAPEPPPASAPPAPLTQLVN